MSDEKTEEPSDHKLRKSREEGQMAKSQDMPIAASLLACMLVLLGMADTIALRLRLIIQQAIDMPLGDVPMHEIYQRVGAMALQAAIILVPIVIAAALGAAIGMAAHVGFQITPKALSPKFDSLNPAQGLKNIFSMKSLITFVLMLIKAIVISFVVWQVIVALLPMLSGTLYQNPQSIAAISWASSKQLLLAALGVFVVVAPLDYMVQKKLFLKGQRMSKDEVRREYKSLEGDPHIKGERKQIAREIVESDPHEAMGKADALVVNPTHFSVAIRYRRDEVGVPIILAKGMDESALELRQLAAEFNVPMHSNPPLARALYVVPVRKPIPEELFEAVAEVLKWANEQGIKEGRTQPDASYSVSESMQAIDDGLVQNLPGLSAGHQSQP